MNDERQMNDLEAQDYLNRTDFYFTIDKYAQLTEPQKQEFTTKREVARQILRALSNKDA